MTHTTQVLSDEQIEEIRTEVFKRWQAMVDRGQIPGDDYCDHELSRAIESATLKAVSGQEPVAWKPVDADTVPDKSQRIFWMLVDGAPVLGYYVSIPFLEKRDADGRYIDQQDAEEYWATYADGEQVEPTHYCELKPPSTLPPAQPAPVDERFLMLVRFSRQANVSADDIANELLRLHNLGAALQGAQAPQAGGWMPIETAPKGGRTLLLGFFNSCGKWRTIRGQWMSQSYIDEYWEDPEEGEPGWYETVVESDDMPNCWRTNPTHWQHLPPAPQATKGQP